MRSNDNVKESQYPRDEFYCSLQNISSVRRSSRTNERDVSKEIENSSYTKIKYLL